MKFFFKNTSTLIWISYLSTFILSDKVLAQFHVNMAKEILKEIDREYRANESCDIPNPFPQREAHEPASKKDSECFKDKIRVHRPYVDEFGFGATSFSSDTDRVCYCMRRKISYDGKVSKLVLDEENIKLDLIKGNFRKKMEELSNLQNGMMVQIQSLTSDLVESGRMTKDDHLELTANYKGAIHFDTIKPGELYKKSMGPKVESQILFTAEKTKLPPDKISLSQFPNNEEFDECFSMKSFWQMETMPNQIQDKEFLTFFKDLKEIDPKIWEEDRIKQDLNSSGFGYASDEKLAKSRLSFITKNPLYANLFAANDSKVKTHQNQLLKLLKMKYSDNQCPSQTLDCFHFLQEKHRDLNEKISLIFKNPEVIIATKIVQAERAQNILDNPKEMFAQKVPLSRMALEERFRLISGNSIHGCANGLTRPELVKCNLHFPPYCPMAAYAEKFEDVVRKMKFGLTDPWGTRPKVEEGFFNTLAEDYTEKILSDLNPNPKKNPKFKDLVDLVCNQSHVKTVGDKKEEMIFSDYKEKFLKENCEQPREIKTDIRLACENPNFIIVEFLKEFSELKDPHMNRDYKSYRDELIQNFGAFATSSKMQLEKADELKLNQTAK